MATHASSASGLLGRAEDAWAEGDGEAAMAFFGRAADLAEAENDLEARVAAVLGLARGQRYNLTPGLLPIRLHATYDLTVAPAPRARLAAALARCWAYANEPLRARPFALEALELADGLDDPLLRADALDAALASHWSPDEIARRREWALELDDAAAHLLDPDARLQAQLWGLTVAWEVLDLPRMHRCMRAIEQLGEESARARFFAGSRRLPLELLRDNVEVAAALIGQAERAAGEAVVPDSEGVLHGMRGYAAFFTGDSAACADEAVTFESYSVEYGVAVVRAEAAMIWLGAERLDKVAEMVGAFTPVVLEGLPFDNDWLLTVQCVLEGALAVEDRELVSSLVSMLEGYGGRSVVNAGAVMWHGVTDDTLARGFALLGDPVAAARHREAALATYERVGARWWRDRLIAHLPGPPGTDQRGAVDRSGGVRVVHLHEQPGGLWLVGREGATHVLPRMRGLAHLHRLVSEPDRDIPVATLSGGGVVESGLEVLDDQARRAYRNRLAELGDGGDPTEEEERAWLLAQLGSATGLSGRRRTTGASDERARVAVRKAIVSALARIAEADPWLGQHLYERVHTGLVCRYESDPQEPVTWLSGRT